MNAEQGTTGAPPALPPRTVTDEHGFPPYNPAEFARQQHINREEETYQPYNPADYAAQQPTAQLQAYAPPPQRLSHEETIQSPIHYTRDPKRLVAYLVPFPKPRLHGIPEEAIPQRFLIYTPPPPPLQTPKEGDKESKIHKVQRKWEAEIREAKTANAKVTSWKGIKGRVTKGIDWGMSQTKSSNLEFLNRIGASQEADKHVEDGNSDGEETKKTVPLSEMLLVHPPMPGTPEQIRAEFVNTMLRSKSKAQRDTIIATGLLPVSAAIDILATLVWPFGGLLEVDAVWAYSSFRGAKTSRSVTKRLTSSGGSGKDDETLKLEFTPSPRLAVLERYLAARCHERDPKLFASAGTQPSETEVLEAIGWTPSEKGGADRNWEDEQWEISEVKDDLKSVMSKGSKEWDKWCKLFEKNPEKAGKK